MKRNKLQVGIAATLLAICMLTLSSCVFESGTVNQGSGNVNSADGSQSTEDGASNLGDYNIVIKSCRLATDYDDKPVIIIAYDFTNNGERAESFDFTIDAKAYQNGIGLTRAYILDESANYDSDDQERDIQKGVTLTVEVAYVLNDTTTPVDVEVMEYMSFSSKKLVKTFELS